MDEELLETESHGLEITSAVLHVLDGNHHNLIYSEETLDLEEPTVSAYVTRHISRMRKDIRLSPGTFNEGSSFRELAGKYFHHEISLIEFSHQALESFGTYLSEEEPGSFDVLFADYRFDDVPYIGILLLEGKPAVTHMTDVTENGILNTISAGSAVLPPSTAKLHSFAVVNLLSYEIEYVDDTKWNHGISVINEKILDSTGGISKKEIVETVKMITEEVAEEYEESPVILMSKVKNYIASNVSEGLPVSTSELAEEVFDARPEMKQAFLKRTEEHQLPEETELPKASVSRTMRYQRIRTDTGIELVFPTEYFANTQYIEFVNHPDGTISIEIRNIGRISNR